ncbi:hypothetical protein [Cryptosporangium minutisporangium]
MCWEVPPADPDGPSDPRLDVYRSRYAEVFDGGEARGYLATWVQTWWTPQGPWWRRRWTDPRELVVWMWVADGALVDDGVIGRERLDEELANWSRNRFAYRGRYLRLKWLSGAEAAVVRREQFATD